MRLRLSKLNFSANGCVGVCSVKAADKQHPNKMPFEGVLLILDSPSNKPPHGSEGHRILVPKDVAKRRLATLIGTGINYQRNDLSGHAPRHKVGVITGAWIDGNKLKVSGFLWKRDFPEVQQDLRSGRLGMSMELSDIYVRSKHEDIWYLQDFYFTGATVLHKTAAAYYATALAAAAAKSGLGGSKMTKVKARAAAGGSDQGQLLVSALAASIGPSIQAAIAESLKPLVSGFTKQQASISRMAASFEEMKALQLEAARDNEEGEEEEVEEVKAAKDKEEEEEEEVEEVKAAKDEDKHHEEDDDEEDDADLDAEIEHLEEDHPEEEPGEVNEDAENEGSKTTRTGKVGKAKHMKELGGSSIRASSVIRELYASHRALRKKYRTLKASADSNIEALKNQVEALEAQVENYAERVDRRSVNPELANFLAKNNVDVRELRAEGRKLSVNEIDNIFANSPVPLDPTTRMWFKNQLLEAEMMEQGEINRSRNVQ